MTQPSTNYRLVAEIKIRREAFGGILYKYGCADRGALSFINSPQLIGLLIAAQQQFDGDLNTAIERSSYSPTARQRLYAALDDLARRGYVLIEEIRAAVSPAN
jgi:putative mycofactocin binding protein MftB